MLHRLIFPVLSALIALFPVLANAQLCQTDVDLNTWTQEGDPATGNWVVNAAGTAVLQTVNVVNFGAKPTFFISPDTFHNVRIEGTLRVYPGLDDDWIGFVFGYQDPVGNTDDYDFWLFDWKKTAQPYLTLNAQEGMALSHFQGTVPPANLWNYVWGHQTDANFEVVDTDYGPGRGWQFNVDYDFTLVYTSTRTTIMIGADTIFDIAGCFERGRFGFYNFSQSDVLYSNFSYSLETNFEALASDVCTGVAAPFQFTDTCFGNANTTANLASWLWDFGDGNTSTALNPSHVYSTFGPKTVRLLVEDVNGCRDTVIQEILVHPAPHPLAAPQDTTICPGDSVLLIPLDTFPITPVSLVWSPGNVPTGLLLVNPTTTSTYTVTATNLCGVSTMSTTVTVVPPIDLTANTADATCADAADGTIQVLPTGGAGGYNFVWTPLLANTATPVGLDTGTYALTLTDAIGCSLDTAFSIAEPLPLTGSLLALTDVDCNGASTGSVTLAAAGGTAAYSFASDGVNFAATPTLQNLSAGPYTFTIQDANGCTFTVNDTIDEPAALLLAVDTQVNPTCSGTANGSVTLAASGGTGTYEFSQNGINFSPNPTFGSLANGNYTFTVRDASGCLSTVSTLVSEPNPLVGTLVSVLDPECAGAADGLISLAASGGTPGYLYSIDGLTFGPSPDFLNLSAGTYSLSVQDQSGCTLVLDTTLTDPPVLTAFLDSVAAIRCFGETNGYIQLGASGGFGLYNFSIDGLAFFESDSFPGLGVGTYELIVRDANGCADTVSTAITEPAELTAVAAVTAPITCTGSGDGALVVAGTGGTGAYTYAWDPVIAQTPNVAGLNGGNYTAVVTDANGCQATASVVLTEPAQLVMVLDSLAAIRCAGENNGYAAFSASGGVGAFTYTWDSGAGPNSPVNAALTPGAHVLTVTDANGCVLTTEPIVINEPLPLALALSQTDASCFNLSDGTALATITGGTEPYDALWQGIPTGTATGLSVGQLPAGTYTVQIADANGCLIEGAVSVAAPPPLLLELADVTDGFCDLANGDALVSASGGNPDYTYTWNTLPPQEGPQATNLPEGTFTVSVTDNLGCTESLDIPVGNAGTPTAAFSTTVGEGDTLLLENALLEFQNESEGAIAWFWDFGTGTAFSNEANPRFSYSDPGTFTIVLTAVDPNNACPDVDSLTFTVIERGKVFMANAFSPNGDGHNDSFFFNGHGITEFECLIFNRWGVEVARLTNFDQGWDGRSNNQTAVPEGVYVYVMKARLNTGERIERGGSITLIR